jgi:hypothetical protein
MDGIDGAAWCDPSSIKQIAGRAGRLSSAYKVGEVTAWQVNRDRESAVVGDVMRVLMRDIV